MKHFVLAKTFGTYVKHKTMCSKAYIICEKNLRFENQKIGQKTLPNVMAIAKDRGFNNLPIVFAFLWNNDSQVILSSNEAIFYFYTK